MTVAKKLSEVITKKVRQRMRSRYERAGQVIVDKARELLKANVAGHTNIVNDVGYEIKDDTLVVFCTNPVGRYLEEGTKPHIIRAKPGKTLAFGAGRGGTRKNGTKYNMGDTIMTKVVHHPGFEARPWFHLARHLTKPRIEEILAGKK